MKISELLEVLSLKPVSVQPQQPVVEAARTMAEHNIGVLVVVDEMQKLTGVISEREMAFALGNLGEAVIGSTVADLMTSRVITIRPDKTVEDAVYVFKAGLFRHLIVVDNGRPVGVISIRDIVQNIAPLLLEAKERLEDEKLSGILKAMSAA